MSQYNEEVLSIFKPSKCTNRNATEQIIKHTSHQVPTPTIFSTKVPSTGSLLKATGSKSNKYFT
jgi:hypothetical protein